MTEYVRLGDVCDFLGGFPFDSKKFTDDKKQTPLLRIRDVLRGYTTTYTSEEFDRKYLVSDGDMLIGMDGDFNIGIWRGGSALLNQRVCKVTCDDIKIDSRYVFFLLKTHLLKIWDKTTYSTVKHLSIKTLQNLTLPLPSLEEQKRIAAALDKMSSVIAKRKRQIALLDEAAKSLFVEMFGDPVENPMGWDTVTVVDVCESIVGGGTPSKSHDEYYKGDIPWVTPKDMKSIIISDSKDHITEEAIQNSTTKLVPKDTVLMVVRSGILKHTLPVAITSRDVTLNQDMKAYITNEKTSPLYLLYFFKTMERKLLHKVKGTTADNLDFGMLKKLPYPLPPLDLQNLFAARIEALEAQRASCERGLSEMEMAFSAMMQEYFG